MSVIEVGVLYVEGRLADGSLGSVRLTTSPAYLEYPELVERMEEFGRRGYVERFGIEPTTVEWKVENFWHDEEEGR
jgi:hypothetical protein